MANAAEVGMDENERATLNFPIGRLGVSSVECWMQAEMAEGEG